MAMELYIKEPYRKECDAIVLSSEANTVELDQNIFYPTSGGQPNDLGKVDDALVTDVRKIDGKVRVVLDQQIPVGTRVHCVLDWERRYKHMRMHTAAHLLSAVINKTTGALITGNQLGMQQSRIDFNLETFDREQIKEFEAQANALIAKALPVESSVMTRAELEAKPDLCKLAKGLPEAVQEVRVLDIVGYDAQPCGGTHLHNIREIGKITIESAENKGKSNRRLYFTLAAP